MAVARRIEPADTVGPQSFRIPPVIRKNTVFLALAQAFSGAGMGLVYSMGPLMILAVSGSTALTGLSVTLMGLSRFVVSYPVGKMTDALGRKPAMLFGLAVGFLGAILVGASTLAGVFPLLVCSMFVFGMGMNTAQQLRVAAADMYPPSRRAEGLGYVLTGSLVGVGVGPSLVAAAQHFGPILHVEPLGLPWLFVPLLIVPGMFLVTRVRPDPKVIAEHLGDYYPGYRAEHFGPSVKKVTLRMFWSHKTRRVAVITNMAAQANMAVVMVNSSLLLHHHGVTLAAIAISSAIHSIGMWAFSIPLGRMSDRFGRKSTLLFGGVTSTIGAIIVTQGADYAPITFGAFLVGLGWAGTGIATLAVIADTTRPAERGRCVGLNESMAASVNVLVPLLAGPIAAAFGVASTGLLAAAVMVPALLMLVLVRQALSEAATAVMAEQPVLSPVE